MPTASGAVEANLAAMAEGTPEGESAEATTATTDSSPTIEPVTEVAQAESTTNTTEKQTVPYERFQEVNAAKNTAQAEVTSVQAERDEALSAKDLAISNLTQFQEDASETSELNQHNAALLAEIRGLKDDDVMGEHVMAIDQYLRGESPTAEEVNVENNEESTEETPTAELEEARELLAETRQELLDHRVEVQNTDILNNAREVTRSYMDDLPPEYTEQDKDILVDMLSPNVDWERIEEDPEQLVSAIAEGLTATLEKYGTPRGEVAATAATEAIENHTVEAPKNQAQEALDRISEIDFSEIDKDGNPVQSNDDFSKALGDVMRANKSMNA